MRGHGPATANWCNPCRWDNANLAASFFTTGTSGGGRRGSVDPAVRMRPFDERIERLKPASAYDESMWPWWAGWSLVTKYWYMHRFPGKFIRAQEDWAEAQMTEPEELPDWPNPDEAQFPHEQDHL